MTTDAGMTPMHTRMRRSSALALMLIAMLMGGPRTGLLRGCIDPGWLEHRSVDLE